MRAHQSLGSPLKHFGVTIACIKKVYWKAHWITQTEFFEGGGGGGGFSEMSLELNHLNLFRFPTLSNFPMDGRWVPPSFWKTANMECKNEFQPADFVKTELLLVNKGRAWGKCAGRIVMVLQCRWCAMYQLHRIFTRHWAERSENPLFFSKDPIGKIIKG